MSFELFLLFAGSLATGVSVLTAFIYMRSQKRSLIISEEGTEVSDEAITIERARVPINETKIDIKIVGGNITLTAQDMDVETLERLIETLTAKQADAKTAKSINEHKGMEEEREADTA